jgi:hypothetical protein
MSIKLMSEVWTLKIDRDKQLVLLALADHADDEGYCYPSTAYVAWKTNYSKRQTQRVLDELERDGILKIARPATPTTPNIYRIQLKAAEHKSPYQRKPAGRGDIYADRGDISERSGVTFGEGRGDIAVSPKPSVEPSNKNHQKISPERPSQKSDYVPSPQSTDVSGFAALMKDMEQRFSRITPRLAERIGELWDDFPDLDLHIFAMQQTDTYADGFNLSYYEACLNSEAVKREQKKNGKPSSSGEGFPGERGRRRFPGNAAARGNLRTDGTQSSVGDAAPQQIPRFSG